MTAIECETTDLSAEATWHALAAIDSPTESAELLGWALSRSRWTPRQINYYISQACKLASMHRLAPPGRELFS
jgi:hypothetical protein